MLKMAIPAEAGPGTCSGQDVTLAGEEVEGLARSLKNKTKGRPQHPSAAVHRGKPASALQLEKVGVRSRGYRSSGGGGQGTLPWGEGKERGDLHLVFLVFVDTFNQANFTWLLE